jgi:ferredoxin-NADP reductase
MQATVNQPIDELRRVRVSAIRLLATDILAFDLIAADGRPLAPFTAGSHVDVYTPSGVVRQYSLCSDPRERNFYTIAVKNELAGRGGSTSMHANVEVGTLLGIAGPRNHFPLLTHAKSSVFVAGGIGITPIYAMIQTLAANDGDWTLHYCARSEEHAAFHDELTLHYPSRVKRYFSESPLLDPREVLRDIGAESHLYCCGPAGLMKAVQDAGSPDDAARLHFEWFSAPAAPHAENQGFEVQLASTGAVLEIPPEKSILHVLREQGIDVPCSCEEGVCGSCETRIVSGEVEHRDALLTAAERQANRSMMVCVSRARGRVVLDL